MPIAAIHPNLKGELYLPQNYMIKPSATVDYSGGLTIGEFVNISDNVFIYTHNHHFEIRYWQIKESEHEFATPLEIMDYAFIGTGAIILAGVKRIGKCSVIGAGSVVTKEVPDFEVWAGNPAKKIGDV